MPLRRGGRLLQYDCVSASRFARLGCGDAEPVFTGCIADQLNRLGVAGRIAVDREDFFAVRIKALYRHIDGVLLHEHTRIFARSQPESVVVRVAARKLAPNGYARYEVRRLDGAARI